MTEQTTKIINALSDHKKMTASQIERVTGVSKRRIRHNRVMLEESFIDELSNVLVEADGDGYYIVDINSDTQVNKFIKRRKAMIFTSLKLLFRLERAIMKRRQVTRQLSFNDMLDDFKVAFESEVKDGELQERISQH